MRNPGIVTLPGYEVFLNSVVERPDVREDYFSTHWINRAEWPEVEQSITVH